MMEFVEASGVGDVNKNHRRSVNKTTGGDRSRKGVFHCCAPAVLVPLCCSGVFRFSAGACWASAEMRSSDMHIA
jgi:hypothetical protein